MPYTKIGILKNDIIEIVDMDGSPTELRLGNKGDKVTIIDTINNSYDVTTYLCRINRTALVCVLFDEDIEKIKLGDKDETATF